MKQKSIRFLIFLFLIVAAGLLLVPEVLNTLIGNRDFVFAAESIRLYVGISKFLIIFLVLFNLRNILYFTIGKNFADLKISLYMMLPFLVFFKLVDYSKFYLEKKVSDKAFNAYQVRFALVENNQFVAHKYFAEKVDKTKVNSIDDLVRQLSDDFRNNLPHLNEVIGAGSQDLTLGIYLMGYVSQIWAYGNTNAPAESVCVFNNEIDKSGFSEKRFSDYIASRIGCCTDYAYLLKAFLDRVGFRNRLVLIKGHIFNEINFPEHTYVLDANINVVYNLSWKDIIETDKPFEIFSFAHVGMDRESPYFRSIIGNFKQKMYWLVNTRYSYFEYKDQIPEPFASLFK